MIERQIAADGDVIYSIELRKPGDGGRPRWRHAVHSHRSDSPSRTCQRGRREGTIVCPPGRTHSYLSKVGFTSEGPEREPLNPYLDREFETVVKG